MDISTFSVNFSRLPGVLNNFLEVIDFFLIEDEDNFIALMKNYQNTRSIISDLSVTVSDNAPFKKSASAP